MTDVTLFADPRDLTEAFFDRFWIRQEFDGAEELLYNKWMVLGLGETVVGVSGFEKIIGRYHAAFDEIHLELVDFVADDQGVAGHVRFSATHRVMEREVDFVMSFHGMIRQGRFERMRHVVDDAALLEQLSLLDPRVKRFAFEV